MSHNTLENYYSTIFSLTYHHKWPGNVEDMIPFERDIYIDMIRLHINKLKQDMKQEQNRIAAIERSRK